MEPLISKLSFPLRIVHLTGNYLHRYWYLNIFQLNDSMNLGFPSLLHVYKCILAFKVSKGAKIRNRNNQVPQMTQNTNGKVKNLQ